MLFRQILLNIAFLTLFFAASAQTNNGTLQGSQSIKTYFTANPYEIGTTISHQLYLTDRWGLQTNIGVLFPISDEYLNPEDYSIHGSGIRLNPEFRFYPSFKNPNKRASFFIGGGPMIKAINIKEREWQLQFDPVISNRYSKLNIGELRNISYGLMATIGVEGYFDRSKRFLFDVAYSFGLTQNHVSKKGDEIGSGGYYLEDISVSNRNSGILPYIDFKLGVGYRFGKK